jgi:hypothetical protein
MDRSDVDKEVQFPAGLRVLVVDDDVTCLCVLKKMLLQCRYEGKQLLKIFRGFLFRKLTLFPGIIILLVSLHVFSD